MDSKKVDMITVRLPKHENKDGWLIIQLNGISITSIYGRASVKPSLVMEGKWLVLVSHNVKCDDWQMTSSIAHIYADDIIRRD